MVQPITPHDPGTTSIGRCATQDAATSVKCSCIEPSRSARSVRRQFVFTKMRPGMRNRTKVVFLTADQLEERADSRAREARQLPEGEARQNALRNAAQLRTYASMKRALTPQLPDRNSRRGSEG